MTICRNAFVILHIFDIVCWILIGIFLLALPDFALFIIYQVYLLAATALLMEVQTGMTIPKNL